MAKTNKTHRLFFSADLEPETQSRLIDIQDLINPLSARPVSSQLFHITLSFLASVSDKQLESILDEIDKIEKAPFQVSLSDIIFWPKPAVLGLSISDEEQHLKYCKKQIETQLSQLNIFAFDKKKFIPHITLFRQVETPPEQTWCFNETIQINSISLNLSQHKNNTIHYQTIAQWPLKPLSIKQQLLGR